MNQLFNFHMMNKLLESVFLSILFVKYKKNVQLHGVFLGNGRKRSQAVNYSL